MDIETLIKNLDPTNPDEIKALQRALQVQGYDIPIDGEMGPKTANAVRDARNRIAAQRQIELQKQQIAAQEAEKSWQNQMGQYAKYSSIPAGLYAGHRMAQGIEGRQLATEAAQRSGMLPNAPSSWGTVRRFSGRMAPYSWRGGLLGAEGLALRELVAPKLPNSTAQETARIAGTGLVASGVGLTGEGIVKSFTPQITGDMPAVAAPQTSETPVPEAPVRQPAAERAPASIRPFSERLIRAARAAGATGKLTKAQAAKYLKDIDYEGMRPDMRTAIARELGEAPGRNFISRISAAIERMAKSRGAGGVFWPALAAGIAAQSAYSDAEARGLTPGERRRNALAAAGAGAGITAGAGYGLSKLGPLAERITGPVSRVMERAAVPATAMSFIPETQDLVRRDLAEAGSPLAQYVTKPGEMGADAFAQALNEFLSMTSGEGGGVQP